MSSREENPVFSSDIYALGITAIQALTGIHPCQIPESPQTGEIDWRSQLKGLAVSDELAAIIDKMVKSHYRDRYQTVDEVLHDLRNQPTPQYNDPVEENSDFSSGTSVIRNIKGNKKFLIPISIAILLAVSGAIAGVVNWRNHNFVIANPSGTTTEKPTIPAVAEPTTAQGFLERGNQRLDNFDTKEALADFDKALQIQPNLIEATSGRSVAQGWELLNDNKFKEALAEI
ncbi:MAG: hypothetical protein HC907_38430 [Richelia sp. SM1_7_0]|nr:hypothetical protein [Richelia sp. SM1_7_0]